MKKSMIFAAGAALIASGSLFAQDVPDPNPIANPDGTMTWYTGNNTQYPVIQEVIDACTDGDEIVVMSGQYVESLNLNRNDITLRCATNTDTALVAGAGFARTISWQNVTFWNPTEGFENNNGQAILLGANTTNTYVGRPRMFSQLANGSIVFNQMPCSNAVTSATAPIVQEWDAAQTMVDVCIQLGAGAAAADVFQLGQTAAGGADGAMVFWSRSIDDVAVMSNGSSATLSYATITSQNGFGGGIIVDGAGDSSSYVGCNIRNTFSGGMHSSGHRVTGCTIAAGHPMFAGCTIGGVAGAGNQGGAFGVIAHTGGEATFTGSMFSQNVSPLSDGLYMATGGAHATFANSSFVNNTSRFGTLYFDSSLCSDTDYMMLTDCVFTGNNTITNPAGSNWGAAAHCTDAVAGRSPLVVADRCEFNNDANNGTITGNLWWETDITSNYFPRVRLLRDSTSLQLAAADNPAGVTGTAANEGDLNVIAGDINDDGVVDGMDLAALLANWS